PCGENPSQRKRFEIVLLCQLVAEPPEFLDGPVAVGKLQEIVELPGVVAYGDNLECGCGIAEIGLRINPLDLESKGPRIRGVRKTADDVLNLGKLVGALFDSDCEFGIPVLVIAIRVKPCNSARQDGLGRIQKCGVARTISYRLSLLVLRPARLSGVRTHV